MPLVGGTLVFDFLNTRDGSSDVQDDAGLRDYGDVVAWGAYVGMLGPAEAERLVRRSRRHPAAARAVFERVLATRGYLYGLFRAFATGQNPPPAAITRRHQLVWKSRELVELRSDPCGSRCAWREHLVNCAHQERRVVLQFL